MAIDARDVVVGVRGVPPQAEAVAVEVARSACVAGHALASIEGLGDDGVRGAGDEVGGAYGNAEEGAEATHGRWAVSKKGCGKEKGRVGYGGCEMRSRGDGGLWKETCEVVLGGGVKAARAE